MQKLEEFKRRAAELSAFANLGNAEQQIKTDPLQFLVDYTQLGLKAPYAVAAITGGLGNLEPFGSRTHDIVGPVHGAIVVEEMGMESQSFWDTHPVLARMLVEEAAAFFGKSVPDPTTAAKKWAQRFFDFYSGKGTDLSDPACAAVVLGAHAGSEFTAIKEFSIVSGLLATHHPDLYHHLEEIPLTKFPGITAITWLSCHGGEDGVENIHANFALEAAAEVIHTPELLRSWEAGFKGIVTVLNDFFTWVEPAVIPRLSSVLPYAP